MPRLQALRFVRKKIVQRTEEQMLTQGSFDRSSNNFKQKPRSERGMRMYVLILCLASSVYRRLPVWPHFTVNPTILQSPVVFPAIYMYFKSKWAAWQFLVCIRESDRNYSDLDRNMYGVTHCIYSMRIWKVTCLKQWNMTVFKSFTKWNATVLNST